MADTKLSALSEISVPALEDLLYHVDNPTGTPVSDKCSINRLFGLLNHVVQGRLTLTSGTPVTSTDVTGATNVYFTPYNGNLISLYDGTRWRMYSFSELTLALGTLTSGLPYDVFVYDNTGTLTLEALAWTNGTTRATALALQDGVYCKTGALTRRYLGTFYTTATTTTEDSAAKRFLWNAYNRRRRPLFKAYADASWNYTTATWHQANANTANQFEFVIGLAESTVSVRLASAASNSTGGVSVLVSTGIGLDATNSPVAGSIVGRINMGVASCIDWLAAQYDGVPAIGYHFAAALEISLAVGTTTWVGTLGASPETRRYGLTGSIDN